MIVNISQLRNGSEWARDILGLIHVILKRGSWWWWHYQNVPFNQFATNETCFIFPKTGQCNHCISKQAHGWGQYCHNSGAPGMGFGNPGQCLMWWWGRLDSVTRSWRDLELQIGICWSIAWSRYRGRALRNEDINRLNYTWGRFAKPMDHLKVL